MLYKNALHLEVKLKKKSSPRTYLEEVGGGEREREKHRRESDTLIGLPSICTPNPKPCSGIESAIFWCTR